MSRFLDVNDLTVTVGDSEGQSLYSASSMSSTVYGIGMDSSRLADRLGKLVIKVVDKGVARVRLRNLQRETKDIERLVRDNSEGRLLKALRDLLELLEYYRERGRSNAACLAIVSKILTTREYGSIESTLLLLEFYTSILPYSRDVSTIDGAIQRALLQCFSPTYSLDSRGPSFQGKLQSIVLIYLSHGSKEWLTFFEKIEDLRGVIERLHFIIDLCANVPSWRSFSVRLITEASNILYASRSLETIFTFLEYFAALEDKGSTSISPPFSDLRKSALWALKSKYGPSRYAFIHSRDNPHEKYEFQACIPILCRLLRMYTSSIFRTDNLYEWVYFIYRYSDIVLPEIYRAERGEPFLDVFLNRIRNHLKDESESGDHRYCYIYAALCGLRQTDESTDISPNECALDLNNAYYCGTSSFTYSICPNSLVNHRIFEILHGIRFSAHEYHLFPQLHDVKELLEIGDAKSLLIRNGVKEELLSCLPTSNAEARWRFGKPREWYYSVKAIDLLECLGLMHWEDVIRCVFVRGCSVDMHELDEQVPFDSVLYCWGSHFLSNASNNHPEFVNIAKMYPEVMSTFFRWIGFNEGNYEDIVEYMLYRNVMHVPRDAMKDCYGTLKEVEGIKEACRKAVKLVSEELFRRHSWKKTSNH